MIAEQKENNVIIPYFLVWLRQVKSFIRYLKRAHLAYKLQFYDLTCFKFVIIRMAVKEVNQQSVKHGNVGSVSVGSSRKFLGEDNL